MPMLYGPSRIRVRFTPIEQWSESGRLMFILLMSAAICGVSLLAVDAAF